MKIFIFILSFLIQAVAGVAGCLMLIIVMNGYSEKQAAPGIILYIILAIISAFGLAAASIYAANFLIAKTSLGNFAASGIAVAGLAIIGGIILMIGFFAAILLAEVLRK